jgi:hypothetical protein
MNTATVDYPSLFARLAAIDSTHLADADKSIAACAPDLRPVRLGLYRIIGLAEDDARRLLAARAALAPARDIRDAVVQ